MFEEPLAPASSKDNFSRCDRQASRIAFNIAKEIPYRNRHLDRFPQDNSLFSFNAKSSVLPSNHPTNDSIFSFEFKASTILDMAVKLSQGHLTRSSRDGLAVMIVEDPLVSFIVRMMSVSFKNSLLSKPPVPSRPTSRKKPKVWPLLNMPRLIRRTRAGQYSMVQ